MSLFEVPVCVTFCTASQSDENIIAAVAGDDGIEVSRSWNHLEMSRKNGDSSNYSHIVLCWRNLSLAVRYIETIEII
jgi:hypothetical protein